MNEKRVYIYVLNTMADWEVGNVTAEINSKRFFKPNAPLVNLITIGKTKEEIKTMGGLTITPDCELKDMIIDENTYLILPGSDEWNNPKNFEIINKAKEVLLKNGTVCAICGATVALASVGLLDERKHTSNGVGFLDMFVKTYKGSKFYQDVKAYTDGNLITASCTGGLMFAKQIIDKLEVFSTETLNAWFDYFSIGTADKFYQLMGTLNK